MDKEDAATILAILQLVRFGVETVELYQNGGISREDLEARWSKMRGEVEDANLLFDQATRPTSDVD